MEAQKGDADLGVRELFQKLCRVCKKGSDSAGRFHDYLTAESVTTASAHAIPKMQLLQEQRILLSAAPNPQRLMEKIQQVKVAGVQGIDRYIWLVGQIIADPGMKKLVSSRSRCEALESSDSSQAGSEDVRGSPHPTPERSHNAGTPGHLSDGFELSLRSGAAFDTPESATRQSPAGSVDSPRQNGSASQTVLARRSLEKVPGVPKPLIEGVSYPCSPQWNVDRPYLTGEDFSQKDVMVPVFPKKSGRRLSLERELITSFESKCTLGGFSPAVQELLVIDDLLFMMVGIEGNYIRVRRSRVMENSVSLGVDPTMDSSLQELAKRILPLCEDYLAVSQFAESRLHFKYGLVNHAFASALRSILQDYRAMVAQLEHQFRLTRLSLQGLWFFCQPMMVAMQALSSLVRKAVVGNLSGAAILNLLRSQQATGMGGDRSARALIQKLTQATSAPYFGILERWISAGVIEDPYGEFLIDENKSLQKESLSQDFHALYWHQRYVLRPDLPSFLREYAETILTTGKYLNAVRDCGQSIKIPFSNYARSTVSGTMRPYLEHISIAYDHASTQLVQLILGKFDLIGRLRSVKHYFFLDQGDFLVHFMDIAKDELLKSSSSIEMEKLQSLLELALRTSVCASDPYYDDLLCTVENSTLLTQLQNTITGIGSTDWNEASEPFAVRSSFKTLNFVKQFATSNVSGFETLSLDYKVQWPLSLVISRKALTKYQLVFRHLFHFKHVERQLCMTWQAHQATRHLNCVGSGITLSYVLCQRMLHFLQTIEHYMTFEVLEPNWHVMETKLHSAESIDTIIQQHELFLDKCLRECMLLWPSVLEKVESLKTICQQYATTTQWLIPSNNAPASREVSEAIKKGKESRPTPKFKRLSQYKLDRAWKVEDEPNFRSILGGFDSKFNTQLKDLISSLSVRSQTEPCFAHLAQALQGDEQRRLGYFA